MATRDTESWAFKCRSCGRTGSISVSQSDHPYDLSGDVRVDQLTDGFEARGPSGNPEVYCLKCDSRTKRVSS